jgi:hypothetical protein
MTKTIKFAAACCALGASAAITDTTGFVQKELRTHEANRPAKTTRVLLNEAPHGIDSPEFKVNSKTIVRTMFRGFIQDRRWSTLLWGNKTSGTQPETVPVPATPAGCSEDDHKAAMQSGQEIEEKVMSSMDQLMPEIMKQAMANGGAMTITPDGAMDINNVMTEKIGKILPEACMKALNTEELHWPDISACAKAFLKVSDQCINCIPEFGQEVKLSCQSTCMANIESFAGTVEQMEGKLESVMNKKSKSMFGGMMPSENDMMDIAKTLQSTMADGMQLVVPCAECFRPRAVGLVKCMMGEGLSQVFDTESKVMIDEMKSGKWVPEVVPMGPGGQPMGGLPMGGEMPAVPL